MSVNPLLIVAGVGLLLVLIAWGLWELVRRWDRKNAVLAAAPELPIRMVNVWDPVWVRGTVECTSPVTIPHFGWEALHFTYKLEEKIEKKRTTSDGKTETTYEWVTRQSSERSANFAVCQEENRLNVTGKEAQWHYETSEADAFDRWRHSTTYTPYLDSITVLGVVGEKKDTLEPLMHVPLIVTQRDRGSYLKSAEKAEVWVGWLVYLFLMLGIFGLSYGLARYLQTKHYLYTPPWWDPTAAIIGGIWVAAGVITFGMIRVYNSLVIFRTRADQSWSGIDVQLKQRYDLIPNLVEIIKGYLQHEKELLESLTKLRSQAVAGDRDTRIGVEAAAVAGLTQVALVVENYPDLKANQQFQVLAKNLTALEDKIAHARTFFNDSVAEYNTYRSLFPQGLVAGLLGFRSYSLFAAELTEKTAPKFQLS